MTENIVVTFVEIVSSGGKASLRGKRFERIEKKLGLDCNFGLGCEGVDVLRTFGEYKSEAKERMEVGEKAVGINSV